MIGPAARLPIGHEHRQAGIEPRVVYGRASAVVPPSRPILLPPHHRHLHQAAYEEGLLEERFGDAYVEYKRATKKLIPFIY